MIPFFGRRRAADNRAVIDRLNGALVAAVNQPAFYLGGGVPDTFNGRFELLVLHLALVVRRLRAEGSPGPDIAQDLVDAVFRQLDPAMRELGVGDLAVPKRMKKLAQGFLGRSVAYDDALARHDGAALADALARNVYGGPRPVEELSAYVRASAAALEALSLADLSAGRLAFPDAGAFLTEEARP